MWTFLDSGVNSAGLMVKSSCVLSTYYVRHCSRASHTLALNAHRSCPVRQGCHHWPESTFQLWEPSHMECLLHGGARARCCLQASQYRLLAKTPSQPVFIHSLRLQSFFFFFFSSIFWLHPMVWDVVPH